MKHEAKTFEELTNGALVCLKDRLHRKSDTQRHYIVLWNRIKKYMRLREIRFLDSSVCDAFLEHEYFSLKLSDLTKRDRDVVKAVEVLKEYIQSGTIVPKKEIAVFDGPIGIIMTRYLGHKATLRLAQHTLDEYVQQLFRFLVFLNSKHITDIKAVSQVHILHYLQGIDSRYPSLPHIAIRVLRDYFKYLYHQRLLDIDVAGFFPKDCYNKQPKLPSIYKRQEVETLINSINRASRKGKRDYAIILLASRLGLRAADIIHLKFKNIHWERNIIQIRQYKTDTILELPLLPEIGNALIDYLKYGRPASNDPHIFLIARSPFTPMCNSGVGTVVQHAFVSAGIDTENRKHGPHALRHSLAGFLLENRVTLPVISEVLGHENSESTRFYLRVDVTSLKKCILDVPEVDSLFYSQKGGFFYE